MSKVLNDPDKPPLFVARAREIYLNTCKRARTAPRGQKGRYGKIKTDALHELLKQELRHEAHH